MLTVHKRLFHLAKLQVSSFGQREMSVLRAPSLSVRTGLTFWPKCLFDFLPKYR